MRAGIKHQEGEEGLEEAACAYREARGGRSVGQDGATSAASCPSPRRHASKAAPRRYLVGLTCLCCSHIKYIFE